MKLIPDHIIVRGSAAMAAMIVAAFRGGHAGPPPAPPCRDGDRRQRRHVIARLHAFWRPRPGSHLARLLSGHGGLRRGILSSYGSLGWNIVERQLRLVDHSLIVERLGAPFDVGPGTVVDLVTLRLGEADCRITLDQPFWLVRDGALTISLWEGIDRLFSLSFTVAHERGRRIVYVGGIQGRHGESVLDRYRQLTRAAHGMRPRDLLVETFRALCAAIDVAEIRAVSSAIRPRPWNMRRNPAEDPTTLDYDRVWEDRGGIRRDDGFFLLSPRPRVRDEADVPARKRSLYRRRRVLIDQLAAQIAAAVDGLREPDYIVEARLGGVASVG